MQSPALRKTGGIVRRRAPAHFQVRKRKIAHVRKHWKPTNPKPPVTEGSQNPVSDSRRSRPPTPCPYPTLGGSNSPYDLSTAASGVQRGRFNKRYIIGKHQGTTLAPEWQSIHSPSYVITPFGPSCSARSRICRSWPNRPLETRRRRTRSRHAYSWRPSSSRTCNSPADALSQSLRSDSAQSCLGRAGLPPLFSELARQD